MCNILEFCQVVLEKKIFKGLHQISYILIVFGYYQGSKCAFSRIPEEFNIHGGK